MLPLKYVLHVHITLFLYIKFSLFWSLNQCKTRQAASTNIYTSILVFWGSIYPTTPLVFEQLSLMCSRKGVVDGEELLLDLWNSSGRSELWGLHASLHSLFICVFSWGRESSERILRARQRVAPLAYFHDFDWFPALLLPLPRSTLKTCSECKLGCFFFYSFVCFAPQIVKLKDSQRVMCLERDVYFLYVAQSLSCVLLDHLRQLLQRGGAPDTNQRLFKLQCVSSLLQFRTYRLTF